jgi:EpsI family protein
MTKPNSLQGVLPASLTLLAVMAWGVFSWQGLHSLHLRWIRLDEPYAVGYPAVMLCAWWLFRHREAIRRRIAAPHWLAFTLFAGALLGFAIGQLVQLQLLMQLGAIGLMWTGALCLLGWPVGRLLLFPLMLMALAVPIWDFLVDPLRTMTVWFTQHMLDALAVPALIDGYFIHLPAGDIEVAGGCSGLNLLLAMVLMGLLFAESHAMPRERRVAIVLLAIAFGILDNWIRVLALVLIAHFSQMQSELVHHHGNFGWWVFAINLLPFLWLAARIEGPVRSAVAHTADAVPGMTAQQGRAIVRSAVALLAGMVIVGAAVAQLENRRGAMISGFADPTGGIAQAPGWLPQYSGQDVTQSWRFTLDGRPLELLALTFVEQRPDKKLIYYSNVIAGEHALRASGRVEVAPDFAVNTAVVNGGGLRAVWWYWWVDGAVSTSPLKTKLLQLRAMLTGDPSAALIALSTPCQRSDCTALIEELTPQVRPLLLESRQMARLP